MTFRPNNQGRPCPNLCIAAGLIIIISASVAPTAPAAETARRPNVLFIAVDDLRPEMGCYGQNAIRSPHLDRLAADGVLFDRAYCMVSVCGASRASLMTGIRPTRNRFLSYDTWAEKDAPGATTLNTHFERHGYHTVSLGKVFHHAKDNVQGWSQPPWIPEGNWTGYVLPESLATWNRHREESSSQGRVLGPAYEAADVADDAYADGKLADRGVAELRRLSRQDSPFLLAVGFYKPHLPFLAPKKYWDLYDRAKIDLPENYHPPQDAPREALHNWGELRAYADIPHQGPLSDEMARTLIHGYYACVSYTDAQIGKLLDELKRLDLDDNTIVVLWGDHGWNLGEHGLWCKHCCFETSMRVPLILRSPGVSGGTKLSALVEFIDIYPTLCELARLPLPDHLQGRSLLPLLKQPGVPWKSAAVGRYGSGDTIRTDRFRFTEFSGSDGKVRSRMLYDHQTDPGENANIAERPANQTAVGELAGKLHETMGTSP